MDANSLSQNIASARYPDGGKPLLVSGPHGDLMVSEAHGKYFAAAKRGNLFLASSLIAGVALPVNAATLASKFTLWNPAGSGVDVELVEFGIGLDSATDVINGLCAAVQAHVTQNGPPTSLTTAAGGVLSYGGLGLNAKAAVYSAATLTNSAVLGPLMSMGMQFPATTAPSLQIPNYVFDGKLVLPPDTLVTFVATVAAITAAFCSLIWAEWPV